MAPITRVLRLFPLAALMLMLALAATPTSALAGYPLKGQDPEFTQHPVIQQPCANDGICIDAFYPPVAAPDTISITGYTPHGAAEQVMLTITDPRTGGIAFSAYTMSVPMTGDYAGYSSFRFTVPLARSAGFGGHAEYMVAHADTLNGAGASLRITGTSNQAQVWSPGLRL